MKRIPLKDTERYTVERFRQCKKTERHLAWLKSRKAGVGGSDMSTIDLRAAAKHARKELQGFRRTSVPAGRRRSGRGARVRAGAGPDAAGHDDRVR